MSEYEDGEGEIEFLDEDEDIVKQCVQNTDNDNMANLNEITETNLKTPVADTTLLVERFQEKQEKQERQDRSRKKRKKDEDSDYDPMEDIPQRNRKRPATKPIRTVASRSRRFEYVSMPEYKLKKDPFDPKMDMMSRRKLNLRIPDYDDPLCLPVRALRKEDQEQRKLKNWNNLCLEHFKNFDTLLRVNKQPAVSSRRTVVLKNLYNKNTGKIDTNMYSKIIVENSNGERKSEVVQSVLPKYREKKLLSDFRLNDNKKYKMTPSNDEVIITKEIHKDTESLVVYKPKESLSLVYKIFEKSEHLQSVHEEEDRKYLKEVACCKICAPCYQTSWRAFKDTNNKKTPCPVCKRPCISMYNLLAHLKSHTNAEVRQCRKAIAKSLATSVEYHYKCRICQDQFMSIKELRLHVKTHKGTEMFKCEVCSKVTC